MDRLCRVERLLQPGGGFGMARGPRIGQVSSAEQQLRESLSLQNASAVSASIVPATAKRYASAVMLYERVCRECGLVASGDSAFVSPSTQTLLYFVNYAARLGHKAAAIRLFLSAIRREAALRGLPDPYTCSGQVPLIVAAAILGNQRSPPTLRIDAIRPRSKQVERIPAGPAIIDALLKYAPRVLPDHLELASFRFLVLSLLFSAFRAGDVLPQSPGTFDKGRHMIISDVSTTTSPGVVGSRTIRYHLRGSKTDRERAGSVNEVLDVPGRFSLHDAFQALSHARARCVQHIAHQSLFVKSNYAPYSVQLFRDTLRRISAVASLPLGISPHSFRIGFASTLGDAGVPESFIQQGGRWKSDAYKRYIRPSAASKQKWLAALSSASAPRAAHGVKRGH